VNQLKRVIVGAFVAVSVAIGVAGLLAVGLFIVLAIGMSQFGSAK
jgi:hypothetical protein